MIGQDEVNNVLFEYETMTEAEQDLILQSLVQKKYEKTLEQRVSLEKAKRVGRPSRMQPEVIERLLLALRQGASITMACSFAGISHDLWKLWAKKARTYQDTLKRVVARELEEEANELTPSPLTPYEDKILNKASKEEIDCVELFTLVDQAIAECGINDLASISKAARGGAWTAAAFRLSKRFPEEYGTEPNQTNVNIGVGFQYVEINKAVSNSSSTEELRRGEDMVQRQIEAGVIEVNGKGS